MSEEAFKSSMESDGFSKAFGEILSNPEMLSTISSMAQKLKNNNAQTEDTPSTQENSNPKTTDDKSVSLTEKFPEILGMLSKQNSGTEKNRRSELLCALKPYLSQGRVDAIDQIIKLSELSSVFKNLS